MWGLIYEKDVSTFNKDEFANRPKDASPDVSSDISPDVSSDKSPDVSTDKSGTGGRRLNAMPDFTLSTWNPSTPSDISKLVDPATKKPLDLGMIISKGLPPNQVAYLNTAVAYYNSLPKDGDASTKDVVVTPTEMVPFTEETFTASSDISFLIDPLTKLPITLDTVTKLGDKAAQVAFLNGLIKTFNEALKTIPAAGDATTAAGVTATGEISFEFKEAFDEQPTTYDASKQTIDYGLPFFNLPKGGDL